ncbi:hypothetical protein GCM10027162_24240 [Streptomyces incanus]
MGRDPRERGLYERGDIHEQGTSWAGRPPWVGTPVSRGDPREQGRPPTGSPLRPAGPHCPKGVSGDPGAGPRSLNRPDPHERPWPRPWGATPFRAMVLLVVPVAVFRAGPAVVGYVHPPGPAPTAPGPRWSEPTPMRAPHPAP